MDHLPRRRDSTRALRLHWARIPPEPRRIPALRRRSSVCASGRSVACSCTHSTCSILPVARRDVRVGGLRASRDRRCGRGIENQDAHPGTSTARRPRPRTAPDRTARGRCTLAMAHPAPSGFRPRPLRPEPARRRRYLERLSQRDLALSRWLHHRCPSPHHLDAPADPLPPVPSTLLSSLSSTARPGSRTPISPDHFRSHQHQSLGISYPFHRTLVVQRRLVLLQGSGSGLRWRSLRGGSGTRRRSLVGDRGWSNWHADRAERFS